MWFSHFCHVLFFKRLGPLFGVMLPNASRVWKIGATEAAMHLGDSTETQLVTRHLGHSAATEHQLRSRYYQAIVGDSHTVRALQSMENLRRQRSDGCTSDSTSGAGISASPTPQPNPMDDRGQLSVGSSCDSVATPVKALQKRRPFTKHEVQIIVTAFKEHIKCCRTPSLALCKELLSTKQLDRTPKNASILSLKLDSLRSFISPHHFLHAIHK